MHDVAKAATKPKVKSTRKAVIIAVLGLLTIFGLIAGVKALQIIKMTSGGQMGMPPTTVTSAEVKQENWAPLLSAVGSVSAVQGAVVSTELGGVVAEIQFENGG